MWLLVSGLGTVCRRFSTPLLVDCYFLLLALSNGVVTIHTTRLHIKIFTITRICFVWDENRQQLFPSTALTGWFSYTEKCVYCAVRAGTLNVIQVIWEKLVGNKELKYKSCVTVLSWDIVYLFGLRHCYLIKSSSISMSCWWLLEGH
jgi:hypothetical protein